MLTRLKESANLCINVVALELAYISAPSRNNNATRYHAISAPVLRPKDSTMSTEQRSRPNLTLYRGLDNRGCYVWSPFVTKLELRLRLSNFPYTVEPGSRAAAPKGKFPYVELRTKGGSSSVLGDSALITKHLVGLGYLENLYNSKPPTTRAHVVAIRAMLEDRLFFYNVCPI